MGRGLSGAGCNSLSPTLVKSGEGINVYRSGNIVVATVGRAGFTQPSWGSTELATGLPNPVDIFEIPCLMQSSKATDSTLRVSHDGSLSFVTYADAITETNLWLRGTIVYLEA